jgi:hypothetical protein
VPQRGLQSQAGNRALGSLLEPRSVQREPMATGSTDDPLAGIGGLLAGLSDPLPGLGAGLLDAGSQALHGVESFAREIPGVGGLIPSSGGGPVAGGIGSGIGGALAGLGGNPLPGLGAGLLDVGSQVMHGVESFAREIPGVGGLLPGGRGAAAPPHAKRAGHRAASQHGAAQHASAHPGAATSHAATGHHHSKHGSGHPSASQHHAAKAAKPGAPGMLESMHQKARLMQFEAGALDTAATVGTGISNFAHEIPFVNELL